MILYLLKVIACSALLIGVYFLLFEKEKNHVFKRFYLLSSLIFSIFIPCISIETEPVLIGATQMRYLQVDQHLSAVDKLTQSQTTYLDIEGIFYLIYGLVTFCLFIRFSGNIYSIFSKISTCEKIKKDNYTVVLMPDPGAPYSFLNYIFLSKADYLNHSIENQIIAHEQAHVSQWHSFDIIFIEILKVVFFFNPILWFYKKAIQTNHEFLADESVLRIYDDVTSYQLILFQKVNKNLNGHLASSLNYSNTKKRLLMMTRSSSKKVALFKQVAIIPIAILTVFLFSTKMIANEKIPVTFSKNGPVNEDGISEKEFATYIAICEKYKIINDKGFIFYKGFTPAERDSLQSLYLRMNESQKNKVSVAFMPMGKNPLPKVTPSETAFENFKNANVYGVWINERKIDNQELNNYINTDFDQVFISKLYGAAKKNRKYSHQVDLMTKDYYKKYLAQQNNSLKENKYNLIIKVAQTKKPNSPE